MKQKRSWEETARPFKWLQITKEFSALMPQTTISQHQIHQISIQNTDEYQSCMSPIICQYVTCIHSPYFSTVRVYKVCRGSGIKIHDAIQILRTQRSLPQPAHWYSL